MVDFIFDFFQQLKDRKPLGQRFEISDFDSWFALYQPENKPENKIVEMASSLLSLEPAGNGDSPNFSNKTEFVARAITHTMNNNIQKSMELSNPDEINKLLQETCTLQLNEIKQKCSGKTNDVNSTTIINDYIDANKMEIYFYILVFIPCLVLYQTLPEILYRKALDGDNYALEKLLRIDWRIPSDKSIAKRLAIIVFSQR